MAWVHNSLLSLSKEWRVVPFPSPFGSRSLPEPWSCGGGQGLKPFFQSLRLLFLRRQGTMWSASLPSWWQLLLSSKPTPRRTAFSHLPPCLPSFSQATGEVPGGKACKCIACVCSFQDFDALISPHLAFINLFSKISCIFRTCLHGICMSSFSALPTMCQSVKSICP